MESSLRKIMKQQHIGTALRSEFLLSAIALLSGNILAQIISISVTPITARLFSPENFGVFALYIASVQLASQVGSLCYDRAIILPAENREAFCVALVAFIVLCGIVMVLFGASIAFGEIFARLLKTKEFSVWIFFVPLGVFLSGIMNIMRMWRLRNEETRVIAKSRVWQAAIAGGIKVFVGVIIGAWSGGLIGGAIVGTAFAAFYLYFKPKMPKSVLECESVSKSELKMAAVRYKNFPIFGTWTALLNFATQQSVVFFFAAFFGPAVVGFYSLGSRVLKQPVFLLSESMHNAYFQRIAKEKNKGTELGQLVKRGVVWLLTISFLPLLFVAVLGHKLFIVVFGPEWGTAGVYVQIMVPWLWVMSASSPANVVYEVLQRQRIRLIVNATRAVMCVVALVAGYLFWRDATDVLIAFVGVNVVTQVVLIAIALRFCQDGEMENSV